MERTQQQIIGLYEKALPPSLKLEEKLQIAKNSGYDYIEISIDESDAFLAKLDWPKGKRNELVKRSQDLNLPFFSLCLSGHRRYPLGSADENTRMKARDMLAKAIDFACDLGARVVQVLGYWVYYEPITSQSESYYLDSLSWAIEKAARSGVMLGIENVDSRDHINSITKAMKVVRKLNSPWLQIYADFANLAAFGFDVPTELEAGKGHYASIHVKDSVPNEVRGIPLGSGMVNFLETFNQLASIGYQGPFLLEMWHDKELDTNKAVKNTLTKVRKILNNSAYNTI